jgi:2-keto-4-pentenoate hydratase/2-oxohepta-3-ene-1,7-dioic acid hydratase in catechol pathway
VRICRFDADRLGIVDGEHLLDVTEALAAIPPLRWPAPPGDALIRHWPAIAPRVEALAPAAPRLRVRDVRLRSPLANPSKIIGIARNRRGLATERIDIGESAGGQRQDGDGLQMFVKAPSAIAGAGDGVALRFLERRNDPEAELTVIVGRTGSDIREADALEHVFGYCIGLDMTLRGKESPSSRKSIDSYAVLGPWIATRDEIDDPDAVDTVFELNGRVVQKANTRDLAFDIRRIVAHASTFFTLHPGDAIMVGTPVGFEPVRPGDVMTARFEGIGAMDVRVRAHAP